MANQTHPYGYWTDDRIIEESKKYKTPIELKINAPTAYSATWSSSCLPVS